MRCAATSAELLNRCRIVGASPRFERPDGAIHPEPTRGVDRRASEDLDGADARGREQVHFPQRPIRLDIVLSHEHLDAVGSELPHEEPVDLEQTRECALIPCGRSTSEVVDGLL